MRWRTEKHLHPERFQNKTTCILGKCQGFCHSEFLGLIKLWGFCQGGFCLGEFCHRIIFPWGILSKAAFVNRDFVMGDFVGHSNARPKMLNLTDIIKDVCPIITTQ